MLGNVTLLVLGAATNWFGISNRQALGRGSPTPEADAAAAQGP
jgi:hypothetical protein